jgi:sugar (pentulose or hexulose) kinase
MYLGIDIGSTSLKAAVFESRRGRLAAQCELRLPLVTDESGRREQDPAALLRAVSTAAGRLRRQLGRAWTSMQGIGLAAQGGSTLLVDRRTGRPSTPMFLWNDTRAFDHFHQIAAELPPRWWRTLTGRDEPGMGLARLRWIREQWPRLLENNPLCIGAGEHVYFALTGEWRQDACHALQSGCYDVRHDRLTVRPLRRLGLPEDLHAPLRAGHTTHPLSPQGARWLNLPGGIPVAGPYNDHEAGYAAVSHACSRPLAASLGTAWVGNFILPPTFQGASPFQLCIPACTGDGRQVILPLMTGNVTEDWARTTFVDPSAKTSLARAAAVLAERLLPPPGLVALTWLNRPNALCPARIGSGGFFGINPATTPHDLYRAVLSGMAFELGRVMNPLVAAGAVDGLVLCGGTAKNPHLRSLLATLFFPLPLQHVIEAEWMGTRGCLFGLAPTVARAPVAPIRDSSPIDRQALAAARTLYADHFQRCCGHVHSGHPYALTPVQTNRRHP